MLKKILKNLTEPFYRRLSQRLVQDLQIAERQRLLHHLIGQIDQLLSHQLGLAKQVEVGNVLLSGVHRLGQDAASDWQSTPIMYDLLAIFKSQPPSAVSIFNYFNQITQVTLKDKSVCFIGANQPFYGQRAKEQGAKSVIRVEINPLATHERQINNEFSHEKVISVYPTKIATIAYPAVDLLFIPDPAVASFLTKYHLFDLGSKVKQEAFITLLVKTNSVFSISKEPPFSLAKDQRPTIFNDNYVRQQLHKAGFSEVECLYSQGEKIDNPRFDKKITHLSYQNGYKIVQTNHSKLKNRYRGNHVSTKTYLGRKLPSLSFIGKPHEA